MEVVVAGLETASPAQKKLHGERRSWSRRLVRLSRLDPHRHVHYSALRLAETCAWSARVEGIILVVDGCGFGFVQQKDKA